MVSSPDELVFTTAPEPISIGSSTVLPATRRNCEFVTSDGVRLVGELALPEGPMRGLLVTLHPLPTHGGFMDSHIYRKASYRLPALEGIGVLRFNTRGTSSPRGTSEGEFDGGGAEREDVIAALSYATGFHTENVWLLGWSFGTELALKYGAEEPVASQIQGAILLSPPLKRASEQDLLNWGRSAKPLTVVVPEFDDYLRPEEARERFAVVPQAKLYPIAGGKHLWVGEKYVRQVLNIIASTVLGEPRELAEHWSGPSAVAR